MNLPSFDHLKGIIWDWNGTLLDDVHLAVECMNLMLIKRDLPLLTPDRYKELFTFPVSDYYRSVGFDFDHEPFELPAMEFIERYNRMVWDCSLHPTALQVLNHFRSTGLRQAVLSAMQQDTLDRCLQHYQIAPFFEVVSGLDDHYAHSKLEVGRALVAELDLDPRQLLLIGDTIHDYDVATALGISCVLVTHGHQSGKRLSACGVPVVEDLRQLTGF